MNASDALAQGAAAALAAVSGLTGIHEGRPVQAAAPYALIETGPELDWSHKSGVGREVRLAITLRDRGEHSTRLRALAAEADAAIEALTGETGGWRLVSLVYARGRLRAEANGEWSAVSEYRARMLRL
ncbi:MAG TPA: DUF3168 domain-containing protein [Allosphingosinicella sp.]|nr:DUF3168 domain-containing protein [Allosphingosinicella sp.]